MSKLRTLFVCQECGYETSKWMGRCPECGLWNSMVEEEQKKKCEVSKVINKTDIVKLKDVQINNEERMPSGIGELDRVLGGGIIKGSLVLVGGDPGIGKSTLMLQLCETIDKSKKILYISGEESLRQIKIRADRLNINHTNVFLAAETNQEGIINAIDKMIPDIVIVDSIQTIYSPDLTSAPGSVSQVRENTLAMMREAKSKNISIFIIGHVTKEGTIAGPRVLEHMVDCVLYFEGERSHSYRVLRAVKNRFGSTNEIGVFEMANNGLIEIPNPSKMFLDGRPENESGSCVICVMEGTRPVLAEIQALVSTTFFGMPRRMASGLDYNRVNLLIAVLEKKIGIHMNNNDAYVNVAGGIKISEPASDLGLVMALISSFKDICIPFDTVCFGEVGLTGEVRAVSFADKRIREADKMGFKKCIIPFDNAAAIVSLNLNIEILPVKNIEEAVEIINR